MQKLCNCTCIIFIAAMSARDSSQALFLLLYYPAYMHAEQGVKQSITVLIYIVYYTCQNMLTLYTYPYGTIIPHKVEMIKHSGPISLKCIIKTESF